MKICLYSPYVPKHLGGGEKYFFDVATLLAEEHQVIVALPEEIPTDNLSKIRQKYEDFLHLSLEKIEFVASPLTTGSFLQKALWTRQFDVCFLVTDGSFFFSLAGKNIVHIQVPFTETKTSIAERIKLSWWPIRNANSEFTRTIVEKAWNIPIQFTHFPMISDDAFQVIQEGQKEKVIINVGRFFRQLHSKRQDILVEAFRQLVERRPALMKGWKLVLVGGVEDQSYLEEVQALAHGLSVEFYHDLNRQKLLQKYKEASVYWHAAGFEVDQEKYPEKVEHFGISTGEAMASGCVPLVVGKGGQVEVLGEKLQEQQWQTIEECVTKTAKLLELMTQKPAESAKLQHLSIEQAKTFSRARFRQTLYEMIQSGKLKSSQ